jgi:hypothetical protein
MTDQKTSQSDRSAGYSGRGVLVLHASDIRRGPHREVRTCVAKGLTELILCADIPLHPGNEQGIYYSARNARLALTCTAAFRFYGLGALCCENFLSGASQT